MTQYSLVPGTNELIRKHPDQGAALFEKHGYHIRHPRYRDYYNGMQTGGMAFFNSLGSLLSGMFGSKGLSATGTNNIFSSTPIGSINNSSVLSAANPTNSSIASISPINRNFSATGGAPVSANLLGDPDSDGMGSFDGESFFNGNDKKNLPLKLRAFHELLEHLRIEAIRERFPYLAPPVVMYTNGFLPSPDALPYALNQPADTEPVINDGFFNKRKLIIIAVIIAAVVVYFKYFKK